MIQWAIGRNQGGISVFCEGLSISSLPLLSTCSSSWVSTQRIEWLSLLLILDWDMNSHLCLPALWYPQKFARLLTSFVCHYVCLLIFSPCTVLQYKMSQGGKQQRTSNCLSAFSFFLVCLPQLLFPLDYSLVPSSCYILVLAQLSMMWSQGESIWYKLFWFSNM